MHETCDQCGPAVSAKFDVRLPSGKRLTFCGHCYTHHVPKLVEAGAYVYRISS